MILRILKILFYLAMLLFILAIPASFWLRSDAAKIMIEGYISDALREETGYNIEIDKLSMSLPIIVGADKISISDDKGQFLVIDEFNINVIPSLFSLWEVNIWNISAAKLTYLRPPSPIKQKKKTEESVLSPDIIINSINIDRIIFADSSAASKTDAEQAAINLTAHVSILNRSNEIKIIVQSELISPSSEYTAATDLSALIDFDMKSELLKIYDLNLNSPVVAASGHIDADLKSDSLAGIIQYNSSLLQNELDKLFPNSTASVKGSVEIGGSLNNIVLKTDGFIAANLVGIDFYNFPDMQWQTTTNITSGRVWGNASIQQAQFNVTGSFNYQNDIFSLDNFIAKSDLSEKLVSLKYNVNKGKLDADVKFKSSNIKDVQNYLPFVNNGAVDMQANYSIADFGKKISVSFNGSYKHFESTYFNVDTLDIKFSTPDLLAYKLHEAEISFERLVQNGMIIRKGDIQAKGKSDNIEFSSKITTQNPYPIDILVQNNLRINKDNILLNIANIEGMLSSAKISMSKPASIKFAKDSYIDIPELKIDEGVLSITGPLKAERLNLKLAFDDINKKLFHNLFVREFDNAIFSGNANLSGNMLAPVIDSNIAIKNVIIDKDNLVTDLIINSKMTTNKLVSSVDINASSNNTAKHIAHIGASFPVSFQLTPFNFILHTDRPFELDYTTKDEFNILSLVKLPAGHKLSGILVGTLAARGSIEQPNINSNLKLQDGKYSYKSIGLKTKDMSANITAAGNKIFFKNIHIGDYFDKSINGQGEITLSEEFPYKLSFKSDEFNLVNNPYIQGVVRGSISFQGDLTAAESIGDIILGPMEIKIPERFNESVPTLNVVEVIEENEQVKESKNKHPFKLKLNINSRTNDKVFVRGWGVNTKLEGGLHIIGTTDAPEITGKLVAVHGKYSEFGKQLEITQGELVFDGPIPPSPYLNIIGTYKEQSTEIRLGLTGSILHPSIGISSTPAMSEEEALSTLLFGSNPESISAFQAFQLASSMRRLSGKGSGIDPLETSRKAIGLDEINIKQDSRNSGNTSIGFGKHLSDKFYIEVEQGFQEGTKTRVEVELTPKITLEGSTESSGNSNVGINWRFDY